MHNFKINWLNLIPLSLAMLPQARAAEAVAPEQWLLEQVRIGEAGNKDDLVRQSLYRLELMDPNNPDVIAARMRLALRQGNMALAQQQLDKLKTLAPQSSAYRQAQMNMLLTQPETRQKLQQARLMATAGRLPEAKAQYDALFHGEPPTLDLAVEYWRLVARLPGQEAKALKQLQALDQQYSGNAALRMSLARMLFSQNQDAQAYELLQKIAADPAGRGDAADLWLDKVKAMPVSAQSVAALNRFLGVFDTGDQATRAREELARQQKLLADPAYQARVRGLAQVDKGGSRAAIPELQKALAAAPNDAEVLGALGQAYSRAGNRPQALKLFRQALAADKSGYGSGKWQSLIKSTGYWLAIDEGDKALKAGNLALARQKYQQARQLDDSDGDAFIGLGDVAVASKDDAAAEGFYQQALRRDPGNGSALRGLVNIYQRQSPEKALAYLDGLPRSQQAKLRSTLDGLRLDRLKQQAETLAQQQQWQQAAEIYRRAQPMAPDDVWLTYRYAQALRQAGQPQQADALFRQLTQRQHANPQLTYAYALYLSGSDRDRQALAQLNTLPAAQWNDNMRELAQRLKMQAVIEHAERLRAAGDEAAAEAYLRRQPADTRIDLLLADWALARGEYAAALDDYQRVKRREPNNPDAQLGEIEAYVAQGDLDAARQRLKTEPQPQDASLNSQRRVANAWGAVGDPQQADALFSRLKTAAASEPAGQTKALVYRDAARLERAQQQPERAQQDYRQAMVAGGITPTLPQDNDGYTYLTRNNPSDDWLKRGIRSDAADLYRQQDVNVTLDHDYWRSSGTGGISDFNAHDTMLQVDMPLYDGRAFLRTDTVQLDAGRFSTDGSGKYYETFGTCHTQGCRGDEHQKTTGTSVAAGWKTIAGPPTSARRRWALRWSTGPAAWPTAATGTTSAGRWRPRGGRSPARCWRLAAPRIRIPALPGAACAPPASV